MSAMSASEDFRIVQTLNFWLGMFANIIPSSSAVAVARLFEAELRHDGAKAAGIMKASTWAFKEQCVFVTTLI